MPKFTGLRFFPDSTKVIFLDLEYYVPPSDRARKTPTGMLFSPFRPGHLVLGGTFMTYFPIQDRFLPPVSIWSWKEGSEKAALAKIFALLQKEWHIVESKEGLGSLMLCGIGISHSDVPTLISKLVINVVADPVRITDVMCGFRQIDLTTATYCQFAFNNSYFAYPKTKSQLYQKYLDGKKMESGKSVWELYEAKNFRAIEDRCIEEVTDALAIYRAMFTLKKKTDSALDKLKGFQKNHPELFGAPRALPEAVKHSKDADDTSARS